MLKRVVQSLVVVIAVVLYAGCGTTQPVHNIEQQPIVTNKSNPSLDEIRQAIVRAGTGLGWQMRAERPGHMQGTLALRTHVAVVDINYDRKSYSINYKDSTNLNYDGTSIHRNYNGWVTNLNNAIRAQLSAI